MKKIIFILFLVLSLFVSGQTNRYVKLPAAVINKINFQEQWTVSPTLTATLNEKSINDVVWSEDGLTGTISYQTLDINTQHTVTYISPVTGKETQYTYTAGIYGRPAYYNATTMTEVTQQQVDALIAAYPLYTVNKAYAVGEKFSYNGKAYITVQAHTSLANWKPGEVPALYREIVPEEIITAWKQPTGSSDAYKIGDKVLFNGSVYESLINANVWSPAAYPAGWKKL